MMMLDEYYNSYAELAEGVPEWRTANKNDLINQYCDLKDANSPKADRYLAAIICRYWPKIFRMVKATPLVCTEYDVYDWMITAILETESGRPWRNPNHHLYGDKNAPDKCVNTQMRSTRLNHLVSVNRSKRMANTNALSLNQLSEDNGDAIDFEEDVLGALSYDLSIASLEHKSVLEYFFEQKRYYLLFIYYAITISGCCDSAGRFTNAALVKELSNIDSNYLSDLSIFSGIPFSDVLFSYSMSISGKDNATLHRIVNQALYQLKKLYYDGEI